MLKRLILALFIAMPAMAQTSFYTDRALQQVNVTGTPTPLTAAIPYGSVRVCSLPLTQAQPCLPLATITDINGNAISNSIGPLFGQLTTDATGRFTFGCTLGNNYQVQVTQSASNTPAVNYPITCPGVGSNPQFASLTATTLTTTNLTVSGTGTYASCKSFSNVQCVDNTFPHGGSDIGDEINKAYAALPANGGAVWVFCSPTASIYNFTTPIVMTVSQKPASIIGQCPATASGNGGLVLNYTPTTATSAITIDFSSSTGGATEFIPLQNFTLFNNNCVTLGGCGSSATGISIGNTNAGCPKCIFDQINIKGFGTGLNNPNNASWGETFRNDYFAYNTVGLNYANAENSIILHSIFIVNSTGITTANGELTMIGGSLDANTTVGFTCTGALGIQTVYFYAVHMENAGTHPVNTHMGNGTCNVVINGGVLENDNVTGDPSSDYMWSGSGNMNVKALTVISNPTPQTLTVGYFQLLNPSRSNIEVMDATPTSGVPIAGGANAPNATINTMVNFTTNTAKGIQMGDSFFKPPLGIAAAALTPGASLHVKDSAATRDLLRLEDTNNPLVIDQGPNVIAAQRMSWYSITAAQEMFGCNNLTPFACLVPHGGLRATFELADQGSICTNGELAFGTGWQVTGTATATAVQGNGQTCGWTVTTGTTTSATTPTITDTLTNPLPAATTKCWMIIEAGGTHTVVLGEGFHQTTLSATAPVFTFNGTPGSGGVTYFVTRTCGP